MAKIENENTKVEKVAKHRFDCVNLAFKETKALLAERAAENEILTARILELETQLAESKSDTAHLLKVVSRLYP